MPRQLAGGFRLQKWGIAHDRKTRLRPWVAVQVCVPQDLAEELGRVGQHHAEWEEFSKENLMKGGDLRRYYPMVEDGTPSQQEAWAEYEEWKKARL